MSMTSISRIDRLYSFTLKNFERRIYYRKEYNTINIMSGLFVMGERCWLQCSRFDNSKIVLMNIMSAFVHL